MMLQDRVALVTGAARGLGWGIARAFGVAGAKVCVTDINGEELARCARDLAADRTDSQTYHSDVADLAACQDVVKKIVDRWGRLDVVVHGTEQAVHDGLNAAINKLRTRLFQQSPRRIARGLVQTLRIASKHPQYGKYIGRDCMANLVLPSGKIISEYISEKKGKIVYAPHSVGPVVDSRSVSIVRDDRSTITVRGFFKLKRPTPPVEYCAD